MATLTVPSIAFSIATIPWVTSPSCTAKSTSLIVAIGTSSPSSSVWVRRACSVKVPAGPRYAMRRLT